MKQSPQYASRPAQEIVDSLLTMPSLDIMTADEVIAHVAEAKLRNPWTAYYISPGIDDCPMVFRPVTKAEMATIQGSTIPPGEPRMEAMVCAGLVYPSYERVLGECQRRGLLLTTLIEQIGRVSGSGPTYTFVRWTR